MATNASTTTEPTDESTAPPRTARQDELVRATIEALFDTLPTGLTPAQSAAAAGRLTRSLLSQPREVVKHTLSHMVAQLRVAVGRSDVAPRDPRDRRFDDAWFSDNPIYKRLGQSYLVWNQAVYDLLDDLDLDEKSAERARFLLGLVTETVAPTNTLLGNPSALRKAVKTRGRSFLHGLRHLRWDIRNNGGLPSMVDTRPFALGDNMAATPGQVIFRNDQLELIQYTPQTDTVHERPMLVVPPQINRYYILDLAPGRSLVEHAVQQGQQVFMISWRNPDKEMRDWDLDTYNAAIIEAMEATLAITGSPDCNVTGVCAGGITAASLLAHMAATGDERINSATFMVTILDWEAAVSTVGTFISAPVVAASIQLSQRDGVLDGRGLARVFAWLRPNDLIWNYWVNNYLKGENPPAFDVLAWNADATNLPAGLHADFMHLAKDNALAKPGAAETLGTPVDLSRVSIDSFVVGAVNDHITPWQGCYETTRLLGGDSTFVLSNAGHIVAMVNPPSSKKSSFFTNPEGDGELPPAEWKASATRNEGTWWFAWSEWLAERSGDLVDAPTELGDEDHRAILPAPGTYVRA